MKKKIYDLSYLSLHPDWTCMSPDGKLVFMSCEEENLVYIFDMDNLAVQNKIRTGNGADAMVCLYYKESA
jgi:WD40 repeat protein